MSIWQRWRDTLFFRQPSMIYEITSRCNLRCAHCYNVWKNGEGYSTGELTPPQALQLADKILRESRCENFTLTGGEPCLREDLEDIVRLAAARVRQVTLISNGTLLDATRVASLTRAGVDLFELPLNSGSAELHNRLAWGTVASAAQPEDFSPPFNAFERVTSAAAEIAACGARVAFVFVATRHNIHQWEAALRMGIALGARGFLLNRYNAGGECHNTPEDLLPDLADMKEALSIASRYVQEYRIGIGASIAMPPCLIGHEDYPGVGFGFCAAGTDRAYYTVSPLGEVRPCNHSSTVLGDLNRQPLRRIVSAGNLAGFKRACPEFCRDCALAAVCQGGCKAAAEACYGDLSALEPFMRHNLAAAQLGKGALHG